jgi:hypothetical protein
MTDDDDARIEVLRADARYAREREQLYRARLLGPRPTSLGKLRELDKAAQQAEERLAHALRQRDGGS